MIVRDVLFAFLVVVPFNSMLGTEPKLSNELEAFRWMLGEWIADQKEEMVGKQYLTADSCYFLGTLLVTANEDGTRILFRYKYFEESFYNDHVTCYEEASWNEEKQGLDFKTEFKTERTGPAGLGNGKLPVRNLSMQVTKHEIESSWRIRQEDSLMLRRPMYVTQRKRRFSLKPSDAPNSVVEQDAAADQKDEAESSVKER